MGRRVSCIGGVNLSGGSNPDPYYEKSTSNKGKGGSSRKGEQRTPQKRIKSPEFKPERLDNEDPIKKAQKYLSSSHWADTKDRIKDRDDFTCQGCGRGLDDVDRFYVHHAYPINEYVKDGNDPYHYPEDLLFTMCPSCHGYSDAQGGKMRPPRENPEGPYKRYEKRKQELDKRRRELDRIYGRKPEDPSKPESQKPSKRRMSPEDIQKLNDDIKKELYLFLEELRNARRTQKKPIDPEGWRRPFAEINRELQQELKRLAIEIAWSRRRHIKFW